ncbi:MAG: redoxin domain-containing protein [Rhodothermales bacterium]|nr:redoxin domain-containing protein [Rhodothermales bacterium]MBO6781533.1 redoxin domain-containing protein [Rhodothermales bacterium]
MALSVGDKAPDFSLFSDEKQAFTLSDACKSGPVVLLFFPAAFTGVCTTELNEVNNELVAYGTDTTVVGISTDSPFTLAEFRSANALSFNLLSDHEANVCRLYGCKYDRDFTPMKLDRISKRSAFVVKQDGTVAYAEVLENAGNMPDLAAIKEAANG